MKKVQLTDEKYYPLLVALGMIKDGQNNQLPEALKANGTTANLPTNDPHCGFVVGKKYKHIDEISEAYYCGINEKGLQVFELVTHKSVGPEGVLGGVPKTWTSKGNNTYLGHARLSNSFYLTPIEEVIQPFEGTKWVRVDKSTKPSYWYSKRIGEVFEVEFSSGENYIIKCSDADLLISHQDCTEVEAPAKELQPWEKHPTLESCWEEQKDCGYNVDRWGSVYNETYAKRLNSYNYSTEAEAKRARATIKLSRIARKWNEGVEIGNDEVWFLDYSLLSQSWSKYSLYVTVLPFYFHRKEHLEKSLEMFPEDWKDFYNK